MNAEIPAPLGPALGIVLGVALADAVN